VAVALHAVWVALPAARQSRFRGGKLDVTVALHAAWVSRRQRPGEAGFRGGKIDVAVALHAAWVSRRAVGN